MLYDPNFTVKPKARSLKSWKFLRMAAEACARYDAGYPHFFVSIDSKGLDCPVSPLEAALTRRHASVDFKRLRGLHNEHSV